jgi:hypothetical protein
MLLDKNGNAGLLMSCHALPFVLGLAAFAEFPCSSVFTLLELTISLLDQKAYATERVPCCTEL